MCLAAISHVARGQKVVLVTPSDRWSHDDYHLPSKKDLLVVRRDTVNEQLRKLGGVKLAIAADQPSTDLRELRDGMRFGSELFLLTLNGQDRLDLDVGEFSL
ncbi:hypothetical protein JCM11641_001841 [Rhodosporidiobolus odoratus]